MSCDYVTDFVSRRQIVTFFHRAEHEKMQNRKVLKDCSAATFSVDISASYIDCVSHGGADTPVCLLLVVRPANVFVLVIGTR